MGAWVAAMRYEDMPAATVKKAKYLLLDTFGCALGAVNGKPVKVAREVIRARGGNPQATVIGTAWKTSCDEAAFLNAMQIRYLDFNDYAAFGYPHHPSINLAPALAIAEMQNLSGKDLLLGLTVGYEVHIKIRDASERRGFDMPSIEAQYASAACAARLLGLNAEGIANAMAIAASNANTLSEVRAGGELSNAKGTAEALAARSGTFAALLSRGGLHYPLTIMDGEFSYGKLVSRGLKEDVLRHRSGDYEIMKSCMKMWPSIGTSQAPIAAALQLRERGIKADDIKSLTLHLSEFGYDQQRDFLARDQHARARRPQCALPGRPGFHRRRRADRGFRGAPLPGSQGAGVHQQDQGGDGSRADDQWRRCARLPPGGHAEQRLGAESRTCRTPRAAIRTRQRTSRFNTSFSTWPRRYPRAGRRAPRDGRHPRNRHQARSEGTHRRAHAGHRWSEDDAPLVRDHAHRMYHDAASTGTAVQAQAPQAALKSTYVRLANNANAVLVESIRRRARRGGSSPSTRIPATTTTSSTSSAANSPHAATAQC